jgi:hypothetical protein
VAWLLYIVYLVVGFYGYWLRASAVRKIKSEGYGDWVYGSPVIDARHQELLDQMRKSNWVAAIAVILAVLTISQLGK